MIAVQRQAGAVLGLALVALVAACNEAKEQSAKPPPEVVVAQPTSDEVTEWDEYTGRLQAIELVEIRARVNGYLQSIHFEDGQMVKKGDLLFIIDPRPYEAVLARARADVELAEARLDLARRDLARAQLLLRSRAVSKEEAETRAAEVKQAEASVAAANAAVESAGLDVEFTHVVAPVSGRTSRHLVTEGNLVTGGAGGATLLTTIVSLDPIHVYFDADEQTYLKYSRLAASGARVSSRDQPNPVFVGLADEDGFPHEGWMDFVDNQLDVGTGTMVGRAVLPNPDLLLSPGLFVRIRLQGSATYRAVLVPDEAIGTDQAQRFVWVVDGRNRAEYRRVDVGPLHEGLRIIRKGLDLEETIIVAGTQRVHPGMEVNPQEDEAQGEPGEQGEPNKPGEPGHPGAQPDKEGEPKAPPAVKDAEAGD